VRISMYDNNDPEPATLRLVVLRVGTDKTHDWESAAEAAHVAAYCHAGTISYGTVSSIAMDHRRYTVDDSFLGVTAEDTSEVAKCLRAALNLADKTAATEKGFMEPGKRLLFAQQPVFYMANLNPIAALFRDEFDRPAPSWPGGGQAQSCDCVLYLRLRGCGHVWCFNPDLRLRGCGHVWLRGCGHVWCFSPDLRLRAARWHKAEVKCREPVGWSAGKSGAPRKCPKHDHRKCPKHGQKERVPLRFEGRLERVPLG
jgi:hypothetical protein